MVIAFKDFFRFLKKKKDAKYDFTTIIEISQYISKHLDIMFVLN